MPPKRRRRHQGLYYHSSPPKILSMIGSQSGNLKREDGRDGFVIKPSNIRIWIHDKDVKNLTKVIWAGEGNRLRSETSTNSRIKRFLENVPAVLNVIKDVHQCVIDNDLEALKMKTSYPVPLNLIKTKDANGLTVMHKAAGLGHTSIVEYLLIIWAEGATERDAMGRTPLHWSVSAKYNTRIYNLLVQAGAVEDSLDNKMKTALDYKQKPSELDRTLLFVVPDAPRVPHDSQPDWNLLPDDESDSSTTTVTKSNSISHRNSRDIRRGSDVVGNGMNLLTTRSRANSMDKGSESEQMYEGNDISNNTNDANEMQNNKINNIENNNFDDTEIQTNANALNGETETSTFNNQNSFEDNEQKNHLDNGGDDDDDNENQMKDNSIEPTVEQSDLNLNENAENTKVNDEGNDYEKENDSNEDDADLKEENHEENDKIENNNDNEETVHENQESEDVNNREEELQDLEENEKDEVENEKDEVEHDQSAEDKENDDQNEELKIDNENGEMVNGDAEISNELETETENNENTDENDKEDNKNNKGHDENDKEDDEKNEGDDENNKEDDENNEGDDEKSTENFINKNKDNQEVENNEDKGKQEEEQEKSEENSSEKENPNDKNELEVQKKPDDANLNGTTSTNDENVSNQSELSYSENDQEEEEQQEKLEEQKITKEDETETDDNLKQNKNHENEKNELDNENDKLQKQSSEELKIPPNKNEENEENNEILENGDKIENGNGNENGNDGDDVNDVDTNNNNHNEIKPKSAKSDGKTIENDDDNNKIGKNDVNDKNKIEINGENGEEDGDDDDDDDQKNNTTTENMKKIDENHNALEILDDSKELPSQPLEMAGFVHGDPDDNQVQSQSEGFEEDDEETRIKRIIDSGDMEQLASLVLNGEGKKLLNLSSTQPEIQAFLDNVQNYMDKIRRVHKAARDGNLRDLQAALDRRKFAIAKDEISPDGASPLHVATIFGHAAIIRYLGGRFPETTTTIDNNGRTALHYAATINDNGHFYNLLTHLGANPKTVDKLGNSAEFYRNHEEAKNIFSYRQLLKKFGANENLEDEMLSDQADDIKVEKNANNSFLDNSIFHTEQGEYLASALGDPLVKGLTEVADKRPQDPVAYLANFLLNFNKSKSNKNQKQVDDSDNIENSNNNINGSTSTDRMPQDSATTQHQQEEQHHEDEKDEPPPTAEASDSTTTTPSGEERDEHGQSMLHFACARSHGRNALYSLIDGSQINITFRDELYRTARDVSLQAGQQGNTKEIDKYVLTLAARGELKMFETMVLEGYDHILDIVDDEGSTVIDIARSRGHYELTKFLEEIQTFEENREELHQAIRDKDFEKVQELTTLVDSFQLIRAKNYYGRTAVHIAILKESEEIVEYLSNTCPAALRIGDNIERTPLHYAMGVNTVETISRILIKKGAKRTVKDLKGRQPTYYFMNKSDILRLQEEEEEDR